MKNAFLLFLCFLPLLLHSQIIPNGIFEEWELIDGEEVPVNWTIKNSILDTISKYPNALEGDYAVRLTSFSGDVLPSLVRFENRFPIHLAPVQVSAQVKLSHEWHQPYWYMTIQAFEKNEGWQIIADTFFREDLDDYTSITLALPIENRFYYDSLSIKFHTNNNGNGVGVGVSNLVIDQVQVSEFDDPNTPNNFFKSRLFPNPASDKLFIENYCLEEEGFARYRIFDIYGRWLDDYQFSCGAGIVEIPLDKYAPGTYFIQHCLTNCILSVRKFVIAP